MVKYCVDQHVSIKLTTNQLSCVLHVKVMCVVYVQYILQRTVVNLRGNFISSNTQTNSASLNPFELS